MVDTDPFSLYALWTNHRLELIATRRTRPITAVMTRRTRPITAVMAMYSMEWSEVGAGASITKPASTSLNPARSGYSSPMSN